LTKTLGSLTGCNIINITNLSGDSPLLEKHLFGAVFHDVKIILRLGKIAKLPARLENTKTFFHSE